MARQNGSSLVKKHESWPKSEIIGHCPEIQCDDELYFTSAVGEVWNEYWHSCSRCPEAHSLLCSTRSWCKETQDMPTLSMAGLIDAYLLGYKVGAWMCGTCWTWSINPSFWAQMSSGIRIMVPTFFQVVWIWYLVMVCCYILIFYIIQQGVQMIDVMLAGSFSSKPGSFDRCPGVSTEAGSFDKIPSAIKQSSHVIMFNNLLVPISITKQLGSYRDP